MDGVIAKWQEGEDFTVPGYFENLPVSEKITETLNTIKERIPNLRLFILSKMNNIKPSMPSEKMAWLAKYPVQFDAVYFCPGDMRKGDYIKMYYLDGVNILLDDFNPNLTEWEEHGHKFKAIKFVNHINSPSKYFPNVFEENTEPFVTIVQSLVENYKNYNPKYVYKIYDLQKRQYRDEEYDSYNQAVKDFATYWREVNFDSDLESFDDYMLLDSIPKEYHEGILNMLNYIQSISDMSKRNIAAVSLWQDFTNDEEYIQMCDFKIDKVKIG